MVASSAKSLYICILLNAIMQYNFKTPNTMHYATRRIIKCVNRNYNSQMTIYYKPANLYPTDYQEPQEPELLIEELENLFNSGNEIILETQQGFDDEGQDCYHAYIIRAEYKEQYYHYWDMNYERKLPNGEPQALYQLCTMEYILKHPEHIITIWAGPF